jgi:hypothetical protein
MVKGSRRDLQVRALDAAQPFDYEARAVARRKANEMQQLQAAKEAAKGPKLTIGVCEGYLATPASRRTAATPLLVSHMLCPTLSVNNVLTAGGTALSRRRGLHH